MHTYRHTVAMGEEKSRKIGCWECPRNPKTCRNHVCRKFAAANGNWQGIGAKEYGCQPHRWFRIINKAYGLPVEGELSNFAAHCIEAEIRSGRVFDKNGEQAKEYTCSDEEQVHFKVALKSF